jgi:hypothetical protein
MQTAPRALAPDRRTPARTDPAGWRSRCNVARAARLTDGDLRRVFAGNVLGLLGAGA